MNLTRISDQIKTLWENSSQLTGAHYQYIIKPFQTLIKTHRSIQRGISEKNIHFNLPFSRNITI